MLPKANFPIQQHSSPTWMYKLFVSIFILTPHWAMHWPFFVHMARAKSILELRDVLMALTFYWLKLESHDFGNHVCLFPLICGVLVSTDSWSEPFREKLALAPVKSKGVLTQQFSWVYKSYCHQLLQMLDAWVHISCHTMSHTVGKRASYTINKTNSLILDLHGLAIAFHDCLQVAMDTTLLHWEPRLDHR